MWPFFRLQSCLVLLLQVHSLRQQWPKSAIFPTLFTSGPKIRYPTDSFCCWDSCSTHNLRMAFVEGKVQTPYPVVREIMGSIDSDFFFVPRSCHVHQFTFLTLPYLWPNDWTTVPFWTVHTYIAYIMDYPSSLWLKWSQDAKIYGHPRSLWDFYDILFKLPSKNYSVFRRENDKVFLNLRNRRD